MYIPIVYYKKLEKYYALQTDNSISDVTDLIDDFKDQLCISFSSEGFSSFEECIDLEFIIFCAKAQNKTSQIDDVIQNYEKYKDTYPDKVKQSLYFLKTITKNSNITSIWNRNKDYYTNVTKKIYSNIETYNKNNVLINGEKISKIADQKIKSFIFYDNNAIYFNIGAKPFGTITNRIGSNAYPHMKTIRSAFIPDNDCIIELDIVAAELNYLLHTAGEQDKYDIGSANDFWKNITNILSVNFSEQEVKVSIYMFLYGAGSEQIAKKCNKDVSEVKEFIKSFKNKFPDSYQFSTGNSTNMYFSKDSNIVFDFYNREIFSDSPYKSPNYFLQSSQSTYFQLFVYEIIEKIAKAGLKTKVLFTHHDSVYIDLKIKEKKEFFDIFNMTNKASKPVSRFRQKVIVAKNILNSVDEYKRKQPEEDNIIGDIH